MQDTNTSQLSEALFGTSMPCSFLNWYYALSFKSEAPAHKCKHHHQDLDIFWLMPNSDALTFYLESPIIASKLDPIQYWSSQLGSDSLVQMSLDFLSAPSMLIHISLKLSLGIWTDWYISLTSSTAASTDVECAFSYGGLAVSKCCYALSDESTHCSTILGSWAWVPSLIPEGAIIAAMKQRNKCTKKTQVANLYMDDKEESD